jgi:hypothetical protein
VALFTILYWVKVVGRIREGGQQVLASRDSRWNYSKYPMFGYFGPTIPASCLNSARAESANSNSLANILFASKTSRFGLMKDTIPTTFLKLSDRSALI